MRRSIRRTNSSLSSMPTHRRRSCAAASRVVPEPAYGSSTASSGSLVSVTQRRARPNRHGRGVIVVGNPTAAARAGRNVPYRSQASVVGPPDGVDVVVVILVLRQKKDRLVRLGRPVGDRLRVRVRLVPDHLGPHPPAVILQRERHAPRQPDQVLGLEPARRPRADRHRTRPVLPVRRPGSGDFRRCRHRRCSATRFRRPSAHAGACGNRRRCWLRSLAACRPVRMGPRRRSHAATSRVAT